MRAKHPLSSVRRLIGKLGVLYNHRLGVRNTSHPLDYEIGLSLPAAESNVFRIQSDLLCPKRRITILELPPVDSAQSVVGVGVAYQIKQSRK